MTRPTVLLFVCLAASWALCSAELVRDNKEDSLVDEYKQDVAPRVILTDDLILDREFFPSLRREWGSSTTRYPTSTTRYPTSTTRYPTSTTRYPTTTTRYPTTTTRYPTTTTRYPTTTTRYPTTTTRYPTTTQTIRTTTQNRNDQSITIGGVYPYDRQLLSRTVFKSSTILTVHKVDVNYSSAATIHCIQIVDLQKNGKNAEITVQSGGIGQRDGSIRFKSQRGEKINYLVIIWGQ